MTEATMTTTVHEISYAGAQNGIAFRVTNAIMVLTWLRTFEGFPSSSQLRENRELLQGGNP
jgi:hypothetical protein